eukprot:TRINITY_DN11142_c0_g2_i1.p1 TRINITY_DN11142_c0_g2~~TRINITY_DN11142_c0_g2_i1.p1  ORF type:complete len:241 (+),score=83.91 TRINITY_DN11142_c0_g2_i1:139-861(+)
MNTNSQQQQQAGGPPPQDPIPSIPASHLVHLLVEKAYDDLQSLSSALSMENLDTRREELLAYVRTYRARFLKAYAAVRWLTEFGHRELIADAREALAVAHGHRDKINEAQARSITAAAAAASAASKCRILAVSDYHIALGGGGSGGGGKNATAFVSHALCCVDAATAAAAAVGSGGLVLVLPPHTTPAVAWRARKTLAQTNSLQHLLAVLPHALGPSPPSAAGAPGAAAAAAKAAASPPP